MIEQPAAGMPPPVAPIQLRSPQALSALPVTVNLTLYQGDDFTLRLAVTNNIGQPADLAGATVRAHIRASAASGEKAGEFAPTIVGSAILLHLTSAVSAGLPNRSVWDCDITINGRVTTLAAGTLTLRPEVSR